MGKTHLFFLTCDFRDLVGEIFGKTKTTPRGGGFGEFLQTKGEASQHPPIEVTPLGSQGKLAWLKGRRYQGKWLMIFS